MEARHPGRRGIHATAGRYSCYRHVPHRTRWAARFGRAAKLAFCEAITVGANVERAAQTAGFSTGTVNRHLSRDACFAEAYAAARRLKHETTNSTDAAR
jgi:hypothetical protein